MRYVIYGPSRSRRWSSACIACFLRAHVIPFKRYIDVDQAIRSAAALSSVSRLPWRVESEDGTEVFWISVRIIPLKSQVS